MANKRLHTLRERQFHNGMQLRERLASGAKRNDGGKKRLGPFNLGMRSEV